MKSLALAAAIAAGAMSIAWTIGQAVKGTRAESEPKAISYDVQYLQFRTADETFTTAQRDDFYNLARGYRVLWRGWVDDVTKDTFGDGYTIQIDMDAPDVEYSMADVMLSVNSYDALDLVEDDVIEFEGDITKVSAAAFGCRVYLSDVRWQPVP